MPSENRKRKSTGTEPEGLKKKKNKDTTSYHSTSVGSSMCKEKCETTAGLVVKAKRERTEDNLHIINDLIRHRSGIPTYVDAVRKGKIKFPRSIVRKMKDTCFGQFVGMVDFPIKSRLLDYLVGAYVGNYCFEIKGKKIEVSVKEIGDILGIPCSGLPINMKPKAKPSSEWANRYPSLDLDLKRDVISSTICSILEKKKDMDDEDEDDVVRLWIIFLFITILGCKNSYRIGKKILDYVDNLGFLEKYNLAAYIREVLFLKMDKYRDSVLRRRETNCASKEYLDGCILVMMVWLYKHTMIAKPDDVYVDFEPYFKKWGGEVILLRPTLADLRPSEVFTNDIPLKKRMSLLNEMEVESSKEDNENSDAADDHSDSSGNSDSSDSNDEKKKKIAKGKKPVVEEKKQKKNTTNEGNAVKLTVDAISRTDKEPPRILVKKKSSKKKKIVQSPIRHSTRLSSGSKKLKKPKESKKVRFDNDEIVVEEGVKVIGAEKSEESGKKEKDDANEAVDEKKSSDDVGRNVPEVVGEQTEILNDEETRQSSKDTIENVDAVIVKEDDPKPSVNDDTDTVNDISEANNAAIMEDEDPILRLNNNSEQLNDKNIDNNVRQVEVIVEEQTILKDTDVHDDEAKVAQEVELVKTDAAMVHTDAAMFHADAVTGEDKADSDKPKEKVRINFTPPSFSLQLYMAEKGKAEAGQSNSEAVKVDSKVVDVSSVGPDVGYQAGHVTYEGNKEPIKLPSYVVKGEGSTDYPTMKKVKEELYEAWELKIKDNDNKLGNAVPSTSNRVDLSTEDDCNPTDKDPKEATVARPNGKGKKKKLIIPKALRK